jgi:hypothetical protein
MVTKSTLFAVFLLAVDVYAVRVQYICKYNGKDLKGVASVQEEKKLGGTLDDAFGDKLVANMGTWSSNKYTATKSARATNLITVKCVNTQANKNAATTENNNMQQLVNQKKKETSRSPSPVSSITGRSIDVSVLNTRLATWESRKRQEARHEALSSRSQHALMAVRLPAHCGRAITAVWAVHAEINLLIDYLHN